MAVPFKKMRLTQAESTEWSTPALSEEEKVSTYKVHPSSPHLVEETTYKRSWKSREGSRFCISVFFLPSNISCAVLILKPRKAEKP